MGHSILMGRKTFESIGKPLPGRRNIVLSSNPERLPEGVEGVPSVDLALEACAGEEQIFVIGGAEIFRLFIDQADRIYLTEVEGDFPGDAFFAPIDSEIWREVSRQSHPGDETNPHRHAFILYERRTPNTTS